jgi:DNA-binding NtrC family response regulator
MNALSMSGWNKRKAAKMLKISYKSLFNKINDLGIGK